MFKFILFTLQKIQFIKYNCMIKYRYREGKLYEKRRIS